jgi:hypothetical protein
VLKSAMKAKARLMRTARKRRWDTLGIALLGASLGVLVQVSHEFIEGISARAPERDPPETILAEVSIAGLALALLFAGGAMVANFITRRRKVGLGSEMAWHIRDLRFLGAVLGIAPVILHEAVEILIGREALETVPDPFLHLVSELLIMGIGGELLFRGIAKIRRWGSM